MNSHDIKKCKEAVTLLSALAAQMEEDDWWGTRWQQTATHVLDDMREYLDRHENAEAY